MGVPWGTTGRPPACSSQSPAPPGSSAPPFAPEHKNMQTPQYTSPMQEATPPESPESHTHNGNMPIHPGLNTGWFGSLMGRFIFLGTVTCIGPTAHSLPTKVRVGISLLEFPRTYEQGLQCLGHHKWRGRRDRKPSSGPLLIFPTQTHSRSSASPGFITFPVFSTFPPQKTVQGLVF